MRQIVEREQPDLRRRSRFLALSFEPPVDLIPIRQELHDDFFEICSDRDRQTYDAFGLPRADTLSLVAPRTLLYYLRRGLRGRVQRGRGSDIHQMGGDFLLDREGRIRFTHVSREPADRPDVRTLIGELEKWS